MFIDAMGLILADNKRISLGELSKPRALAAVPFGGRYRIIDYMLSNMVNTGIKSVGIVTLNKYRSLMDHLGSGSPWDLDRKNLGLQLLPPYVNSESSENEDAAELEGLLNFLRSNRAKYVVIAESNVILNTPFNDFIEKHEQSGADISVMYNRDGTKYGDPSMILDIDRKGIVKDILLNPEKSTSNRCSLGILVMRRDMMIDVLSEMVSRGEKAIGVGFLSILKKFDMLRIRGYEFKGLILRINNVKGYFDASMLLLDDQVRADLFWHGMPIYTKVKDEAPTLYFENAKVSNAIISDGCRIMGTVEHSTLFRGVTVSRNSKITNCVIMQDVHISENCELENVILDKNSVIRPGIKLVGHRDYPVVIGKGAIV